MAILALILFAISTFALFIIADKSSSKLSHATLLWILFLMISEILINEVIFNEYPKAIDVYRNNTELVITKTIKNGVVTDCDTTIIFKK